MNKGFTLIEVIIYIALLAFVIGAGVSSAYYLIESSANGKTETNIIAEAEFLLRKIDWAMTGATDVNAGTMTITKGDDIVFDLDNNRARIKTGSDPAEYLTSEWVKVFPYRQTVSLQI